MQLMEKINDSIAVNDRWRMLIHKIDPGNQVSRTPEGTDIVLLSNCRLDAEHLLIKKATAACMLTQTYTIDTLDSGYALIIKLLGFRSTEQVIGQVTPGDLGNLVYMDGATNTNIVNPGRSGDPCVNYVNFPAGMVQTRHVHPSHRVGLVLKGHCTTETENGHNVDLKAGDAFYMPRNTWHNFICDDEDMIAFVMHPDSEDGPTDGHNPLKTRTYLKR